MFEGMDTLPLGRGCDARIDHYLVDRVPRLGDDKLQMHVRVPRYHDSLGAGAVPVHGVGARSRVFALRLIARMPPSPVSALATPAGTPLSRMTWSSNESPKR